MGKGFDPSASEKAAAEGKWWAGNLIEQDPEAERHRCSSIRAGIGRPSRTMPSAAISPKVGIGKPGGLTSRASRSRTTDPAIGGSICNPAGQTIRPVGGTTREARRIIVAIPTIKGKNDGRRRRRRAWSIRARYRRGAPNHEDRDAGRAEAPHAIMPISREICSMTSRRSRT